MAETKTTEITGTIKNVTFRNQDTGYVILKLDKKTTLCGVYFDTMGALEGARIKAVGEWKKHKSYGLQFIFQELTVLESELFYFLTRMVKGLGKNLALQLIESMGEEALEQTLDNEPEKLLAVKGIKEKKLEKILATWHRFKDLKALSQFLIPLGGTPALVQRIYRELKDEKDLIAQIEENPYRLIAVKGPSVTETTSAGSKFMVVEIPPRMKSKTILSGERLTNFPSRVRPSLVTRVSPCAIAAKHRNAPQTVSVLSLFFI